MDNNSENRRIAKNSLYLYLRMFIILIVSLYTSRINLIALGVSDFGIYNVVCGIVPMFVFINHAMVNATQRYITYELGKGNMERLQLVFSTSISIHAIIAILIILLSETIGLWFLYNEMVIPDERMDAAFWVFQFSIISCIVGIMNVPYDALIIAHEKMSAFAFISMLDVVFKLLIANIMMSYSGDRLVFFGLLVLLVTIIDISIYIGYSRHNFPESHYHLQADKPLMIEMTKFASWNLLGNLSWVCCTQGLNLLLNIFFNPVVNAARGIAVQIQGAVSNFSLNIENAIKPQITKTFANAEMHRMHTLISVSARLSFFALLFISLPIFVETEQILDLWLVEVPAHTANFVRLTILILLSDSLANPLLTAVQATGDLKRYQLTVSVLSLLIMPISYLALLFLPIPEIVFFVSLLLSLIIQIVKLLVVGRMIDMSISGYLKNVFLRTSVVTLLSMLIVWPVLELQESVIRLIFTTMVSSITILLLVYFFGLKHDERKSISAKLSLVFNRK